RLRVDQRRERIDVGTLQLIELPVLQQQDRETVPLCCQLLEDTRIGRGSGLRPLDDREPELLEEDLAKLRGRADIELSASLLVDILSDQCQLPLEALAQRP